MNWKKLYRILEQKFDADRCVERVRRIWETDHFISYDRYAETARYCADSMLRAGLTQVEKLPLKADGKTLYHDWRIPKAWRVHHGTLRYASGEIISDYQQVPCALSMYSHSTDGPVEAEVVNVTGWETLPEDGSLQGKILLTDKKASNLVVQARQAGAVGVLSDGVVLLYPGTRDSKEDIYDACPWESLGQADLTAPMFGFKLSPRQGDRMRRELAQGPVRVIADVRTEFYDGEVYTVSGLLPGAQPELEEVFSYGHLYEPGANDNASGCGALLELAQCFQDAIAQGLLPRPKRSIRFAMGEECGGSMGYTACHPERKMLCAGVADMVGTEYIDRAKLTLRYNPLASASFADAALTISANICREMDGKDYIFPVYPMRDGIGTDNILADPAFRSPAIALVANPSTSYHTSMDTPDRIEPEIIKRNALLLGVYLYGLADADAETCEMLEAELRRQHQADLDALSQPDPRQVRHLREKLERSLYSLTRICPELPYEAPAEQVPPMPDYARDMGTCVPVRDVKGVINLFRHPNPGQCPWRPGWNAELNIPLFWIDGKRNLWEITVQSAFEMQQFTDEQLRQKFEDLAEYFTVLRECGYLHW